jgi:hypothetical protein
MKELPEEWVKKLRCLPKHGMGYQKVDIKYRDGRVRSEVLVLNCSLVPVDVNVNKIEWMGLSAHMDGEV